jgi:hypothetical protein
MLRTRETLTGFSEAEHMSGETRQIINNISSLSTNAKECRQGGEVSGAAAAGVVVTGGVPALVRTNGR